MPPFRDQLEEKNVTERVEGIEWNGCELEKTEQETESRRKSGVEVRKGPKFRHGNQERTAVLLPSGDTFKSGLAGQRGEWKNLLHWPIRRKEHYAVLI